MSLLIIIITFFSKEKKMALQSCVLKVMWGLRLTWQCMLCL